MTDLSESAKIGGLITSRHSEEDDDVSTELLLPSVPIAESSGDVGKPFEVKALVLVH
jgi:hypothetical protein